MAALSGGLLVWQTIQGGVGRGVPPAEAVRLINREKGVLIDVCESAEYEKGHAVGARNIPLATLVDAKGLPGNKTLPILLLCASGARAGRAAAQLQKAGYEKAVAVAGGNAAWREANLPMESGAKGDKPEKVEKAEKTDKKAKPAKAEAKALPAPAAEAPATPAAPVDEPAPSVAEAPAVEPQTPPQEPKGA